jgi:hypothetical protein
MPRQPKPPSRVGAVDLVTAPGADNDPHRAPSEGVTTATMVAIGISHGALRADHEWSRATSEIAAALLPAVI